MPGIYRLKGTIKHYDWGGKNFLPALLQTENREQQPFAEYWMGVHPQDNCTAELPGHQRVLLKEYLQMNPEFLGKEVQQRFGHLPYLLKVLDVYKMLSIQVHPDKAAAEKEFANMPSEPIILRFEPLDRQVVSMIEPTFHRVGREDSISVALQTSVDSYIKLTLAPQR